MSDTSVSMPEVSESNNIQTCFAKLKLPPLITLPTWIKYVIMNNNLSQLSVRAKREIFAILHHNPNLSSNHYSPKYGVTLGEFCMWYQIVNGRRS